MKLTVLSGAIRDRDVYNALASEGIVALETVRPEAKRIYQRMLEALEIDEDSEDGPYLHHLSTQTSAGWTPYLVYSLAIPSEDLRVWERLVQSAIEQWEAKGSPDRFIANVRHI